MRLDHAGRHAGLLIGDSGGELNLRYRRRLLDEPMRLLMPDRPTSMPRLVHPHLKAIGDGLSTAQSERPPEARRGVDGKLPIGGGAPLISPTD